MNGKSYLIELGATDLCNSQRVRGYGYGHDYGYGFRKGRGSRDQIANIHWIIDKQGISGKTSTSASLTMLKPLTLWITTNYGKFLKR